MIPSPAREDAPTDVVESDSATAKDLAKSLMRSQLLSSHLAGSRADPGDRARLEKVEQGLEGLQDFKKEVTSQLALSGCV